EVVVSDESAGQEVFRGDGNPVGVRSESRRYQDLARGWIGFGTLEPYRSTAWIAQGELVDTKLDDELLRAAAGTHRRVEAALGELRDSFETLTLEPLQAGGRAKRRPRELEDLRQAEERTAARLAAARSARENRRPLLARSGEIRTTLDGLESEIALLEAAYRPITERRSLVAEEKEAEARLGALSDSIRWLEETAAEVARAETETTEAEAGGRYPTDFEARVGQAELLWEQEAALSAERTDLAGAPDNSVPVLRSRVPVLGALLVAGGGGIAATVSGSVGAALAVAGLLVVAAGVWMARSGGGAGIRATDRSGRLEEELATVRSRLHAIVTGLPEPPLTLASMPGHRKSFRRQEDSRVALGHASERVDEAVQRAARLLEQPVSSGDAPGLDVRSQLETAREEARTALARLQLRLEEQPSTPRLPPGVDSTVPAVEAARDERRLRRNALSEEGTRLNVELLDLGRASEDVFALERELSDLRDRIAETESEVSVRRFSWELVSDAYEEFRATDQDRLLRAVNRRLDELSEGRLGPVEAVGDLASARVQLAGRSLRLDSPPLSFGEKHIVLLAIRLGAADFLASDGTSHPLLVDEPFTHLDEVRSREVWDLLVKLAADRQVIVTTQDRLVLDHLGIEPDIELVAPGSAKSFRQPKSAPPDREIRGPDRPATPEPGSPPSKEPAQAQLELG
ncbi:MAG: hypothetical protein KJO06_00590, partial [Gemmatimonadetes bacterium]|nr:hypothetical protein [Gemmatimonadota bacterium]